MTDPITDRRSYIGSSDARDILGGNWLALWKIKTGRAEPDPQNFRMALGAHIEPFHIDWISAEGREEKLAGWAETPGNRQHQFRLKGNDTETIAMPVCTTPDGVLVRDSDGVIAPLEVKHTCSWRSVSEAVDYYMPQLQHHLWVTGARLLYFSVIIGNDDPAGCWVGASDDWIEHYRQAVAGFARAVVDDVAPAPSSGADFVMPRSVKDAVKIDGRVRRDLTASNEFTSLAVDFIANEAAAQTFEKAKKGIKGLMTGEDAAIYGDVQWGAVGNWLRLEAKRDKRGAVRIGYEPVTREDAA